MANFPSIAPDFGARKLSAPRVSRVGFADGYEQRLRFGLHTDPKIWDLTFENRSEADANTIESFLEARHGDGASFDWQPPGETSTRQFVCDDWARSIPFAGLATISCTFREVFEP